MNKETTTKENDMRAIEMDSLTLHCSTADTTRLDRAIKLLKFITKSTPIKTLAKKRIPTWKIKPGQPIGCKVTLRKNRAVELFKILLTGITELDEKQFNPGFLSFGIKEYIEIPSLSYQRDIGILGFDVVATLKRKGWRVVKRKRLKSRIPKRHRITKEETIKFFQEKFGVKISK
ncbi:MAG: 50S ribosomal protein L5 [Candidatus Pacearchaeota archaeon]